MPATRKPRSPNGTKKYDPVRSVRASDEVWGKASRRAAFEGSTMSHVLLQFIEGYGNGIIDPPRTQVVYRQAAGQKSPPTEVSGDAPAE